MYGVSRGRPRGEAGGREVGGYSGGSGSRGRQPGDGSRLAGPSAVAGEVLAGAGHEDRAVTAASLLFARFRVHLSIEDRWTELVRRVRGCWRLGRRGCCEGS